MIASQSSVIVIMLRLCLVGVIFTILFAGGVNGNRDAPVNEGGFYTIFVNTEGHEVSICHLTTPQNEIFTFKPSDESETTEKYRILRGSRGLECMLTILDIDKNDEGLWVMSYDHENGDGRTESVNMIVNLAETKEIEESEEIEDENLTLLSTINHFTITGMLIDISLDKRSFEEECYIQPPNGELTKADVFKMENVLVQRSSNYVSCRITLGPMSESLLGVWRLCGKLTQEDKMRCQPANIAWNNNNPNAHWGVAVQTRFSHPVHYGGSVNSGVASTGNVRTCHVITPSGEDLIITSDVKYPHIERIAFDRHSLCSIIFTDIDSSMIGEWAIYGRFRTSTGQNEIQLPLKFFLYNEEQPYEQAYNVTTLPEDNYLVILGNNLEVNVAVSSGQVDNCQYRMPTGQSYDLKDAIALTGVDLKSVDTTTACQITLSSVTKDMLGEWQLIGKFSNGNLFTERRKTFHVIEEDPANPIIDDFRVVENLTKVIFDTELGLSHRVTITSASFVQSESCHLLTPNGLQYAFIDGFNIPNVEIVRGNGIECGVEVSVSSLDMLGEWTLIARATRLSTSIERRRPFIIRIEEISSLNAITISEGADLYLSLPSATHMYDTCKLYGPNDEEITDFDVDQIHYKSCGYIIRNVTPTQRGTWAIVYGNQKTYRATVDVNVIELVKITVENLVWTAGSSVDAIVGPEDAVYCRLNDNNDNAVFDGFGPCRIVLDRVTVDHKGKWMIWVGVPGAVMLRFDSFNVEVLTADFKTAVTTSVVRDASSVMLTCSVSVENEVQTCMFRDPDGIFFIASHGVGQDGYTGAMISYESDAHSHDCTLRILKPALHHWGIWRCAVNTARNTSYGFLTVSTLVLDMPSSDSSPYDHIEPELKSKSPTFEAVNGDAVTMSCSIDAAIHYCYFRAENGTVYNVGPSISSADYEYVGNGFDAGECGINFHNLGLTDSGDWSCNVGVVDKPEEQRVVFNVYVYEPMTVIQSWQGREMMVRFSIAVQPKLEYCRFVRNDGLGFTSDNVPYQYSMDSYELSYGTCQLYISYPTSVDERPWTVFAKVIGKDGELSLTTNSTLLLTPHATANSMITAILLWAFCSILCLLVILAAVSLIPKKNREWTYERAANIRNSLRKPPLPVHTDILTDLPRKV